MKNKNYKTILALYFLFFLFNNVSAEDQFIFESDIIEYKDNQNLIIAEGKVKITSADQIIIFADKSEYSKISNQLFLKGNVTVFDKIKNITIKSNNIDYDKNKELIKSNLKTEIEIQNNYQINTSNLNYFRTKKILSSKNKTTLTDNFGNKLETNDFIYYVDQKKLKTKNLQFTDKNNNDYSTNNALIDLNQNKIAAKDVKMYFSKKANFGDYGRLKGNSMISDNDETIIQKGVFTTCKPNNDCPPWAMQSESITHNKKKKIIEYKNAWLKIYDKPVFYFPKFFHPDPTVERQSGFLIPTLATSANSGNSIKIPYFNALAENKDYTFTPRFYFNNEVLLQNEFRQVNKNSNNTTDFSIKKLDKGTKSHFFSNSKINFDSDYLDNSQLEINLEKTSNDTYLKSEDLKNSIQNNQSLLNSFIKYESFNDEMDFSIEVAAYEDLTKEKNSDKYQFILPSFKFSKILSSNFLNFGNLSYSGSGVSQKRDTNITENYLINNLDFTSDSFFSKKGIINNFNFKFKNVSKEGNNSTTYSKDFENRNFITTNYTATLPLRKFGNNFDSNLSPKFSLRYSPFDNQNISKLDRQINSTNIFSNNRLGLNQTLEGGQSFTLGLNYELLNKDQNTVLSSDIAQIFRDKNDNKLPKSSKMQGKSSDIVGQVTLSPNDFFELNYNYSADNSLETINYNSLQTKISVNNFITSFDFLEENNEIGSDSYFLKDIGYKFNQNNFLKYTTRRNRKTDLTEYYNLIYEYKNDCLVAAIEYNKNYYEDRDIKPNEEIFFKLTITPFSSVQSPNLNK